MGAGSVTGQTPSQPASQSPAAAELEAEAAARRADAGHRRQWLCRSAGGEGAVPDVRLAGERTRRRHRRGQGRLADGARRGCADHRQRRQGRARRIARLHLDGPAEIGPGPRRAGELFGAVPRGHVPGGPAAPPRRQDQGQVAATGHRRRAALERQHAREGRAYPDGPGQGRAAAPGDHAADRACAAAALRQGRGRRRRLGQGGRDGAGALQREDRPPARARPAARQERRGPRAFRLRRRPVAADSVRRRGRQGRHGRPRQRPARSARSLAWRASGRDPAGPHQCPCRKVARPVGAGRCCCRAPRI